MKQVLIPGALTPSGHYSPALVHDGLLFISGQLPIDPFTGEKSHGSIEDETLRILHNLELLLKEAGSSRDMVLKITIYITDISQWDRVNTVYRDFFGNHKPARTVIPVPELHFGFKVEIDAIAAVSM